MKIVTASNGKKRVKISKSEWQSIGKKAGWITAGLKERNDEVHKKCMGLINNAQLDDEGKMKLFDAYQELLESYDSFPNVYRLLKDELARLEGREPEEVDHKEAFYETMAHDTGLPIEVIKERLKGKV